MDINDLKSRANFLRSQIKDVAGDVKELKDNAGAVAKVAGEPGLVGADLNEAIANVQLSYRHLEDARMRLGKTIQALDGGTSVYDK
jgi:DNA anti-recombination protein RmuC